MKKAWTTESAAIRNKITYDMFFNRLADIALNMYQWNNLPDAPEGYPGISIRYLEMALFGNGRGVFLVDPVAGPVGLKVSSIGEFNIYGDPNAVTGYGYNGFTVPLENPKDFQMVYNNYLRSPSFPIVDMYAKQLCEVQRSIDTNVHLQKYPGIVITDDKQRLTMENLMLKYETGVPIIIGTKNIDLSNFQYIDFHQPYVADKLQLLKRQIWNEALTFLGVYNANTEKRERLVDSEVTSNLGGVNASRLSGLTTRKEAAEKANQKFGWNISVDFNPALDLHMPFAEDTANLFEEKPQEIPEEKKEGEE